MLNFLGGFYFLIQSTIFGDSKIVKLLTFSTFTSENSWCKFHIFFCLEEDDWIWSMDSTYFEIVDIWPEITPGCQYEKNYFQGLNIFVVLYSECIFYKISQIIEESDFLNLYILIQSTYNKRLVTLTLWTEFNKFLLVRVTIIFNSYHSVTLI